MESAPNPLYLQGFQAGDKSIKKTLNLTLKVVYNSPKTPLIHRVAACYPQPFKAKGGYPKVPTFSAKLELLATRDLKGDGGNGVAV